MDAFRAVFGFMWTQPLHVTLRQMRIVQIALVISSQILLYRIVENMRYLDESQAAIAYGVLAAAMVTQIWQSVAGMHKANAKDEDA
jgi:Kef-type K+ transport system membrane component KefB